jgi:hypothetical protein
MDNPDTDWQHKIQDDDEQTQKTIKMRNTGPPFFMVDIENEDFYFSLSIFYLLKCAKRIRHKLNKLMKSSPIYNKLQHYLIVHACI